MLPNAKGIHFLAKYLTGAWLLLAVVTGLAFSASPAAADAKSDARKAIERLSKDAMEHYDLLEYEDARRLLNQAVGEAKKAGLEKDKSMAQVHLNLGIVYFAGLADAESARLSFKTAVAINPAIEIAPAYSTPELVKLLDQARSGAPVPQEAEVDEEPIPAVDCATVEGLKHDIQDVVTAGKSKRLVAFTGPDLDFDAVTIQFRSRASDFTKIEMKKEGECAYVGTIPADSFAGELNYYYIAAYKGTDLVASVGSSGAPNIISVEKAKRPVVSDDECDGEDPPASCFEEQEDDAPAKDQKVYFNVFVGTGGGYTSGKTEMVGSDIGCCFAPSYFHIAPELGYLVGDKVSIAVAGRLSPTLGANIPNRSTFSPAGFLRVRYHLDGLSGLSFFGDVGAGVIRNVVKVVDQPESQNKDQGSMGPLLLGAGVSVHKMLGGNFRVGAEAHLIGGVPVTDTFGPAIRLAFGLEVDVRVGIGFAF